MAKSSKKKSNEKLRALMRTQEINELLSKSITESEALQNTGDDRPVYESHVTDLLEGETGGTRMPTGKTPSRRRKAKSKKRR